MDRLKLMVVLMSALKMDYVWELLMGLTMALWLMMENMSSRTTDVQMSESMKAKGKEQMKMVWLREF